MENATPARSAQARLHALRSEEYKRETPPGAARAIHRGAA